MTYSRWLRATSSGPEATLAISAVLSTFESPTVLYAMVPEFTVTVTTSFTLSSLRVMFVPASRALTFLDKVFIM